MMYMQSAWTKLMAKEWVERTRLFADVYEFADIEGGTGHWVQLEAPQEVNRTLEKFFDRYGLYGEV